MLEVRSDLKAKSGNYKVTKSSFSFRQRNLFGIFAFVKKVKLDRQVLLRLVDQPLEPEVGKEPAHDFHTIFHRMCVHLGIPSNVVMLNFNGDLVAILQGRPVDLSQTGDAKRLRIKCRKQLRRLKVNQQKKCVKNVWYYARESWVNHALGQLEQLTFPSVGYHVRNKSLAKEEKEEETEDFDTTQKTRKFMQS